MDTLYRLNLKGNREQYSLVSAMPAEQGTPGAVQRKSGRWYENVVFDDAHVIIILQPKSMLVLIGSCLIQIEV